MTANTPEHDDAADRAGAERAAKIIAESLAQGLMQAEVILGAERERRAQAVPPQVLDTLERFGDALTRLASYTERLGERVNELTVAVARLVDARDAGAPAGRPSGEPGSDRPFAAGGEGVDVTIAAVPGFQGLMDVQRALVRLPNVQGAAVRRYQDDEAGIQLVLAQPMTAPAIVQAVTDATGLRMVVDDAAPDALRLRLRFLA
jgi:hypothetical protein